jgi:excisionase family DNA binding protein
MNVERAYTVRELAARWRCRPARVRQMIRAGTLPAIQIGRGVRIVPEAVRQAEQGPLAVRRIARRRRPRETFPAEVLRVLGDG